MAEFALPPPSPFLALPGEPTVPWNRWIESFETYITALGITDLSDARKMAILKHCLGMEGHRVFGMLGTVLQYRNAVTLLAGHFSAPQSALLRQLQFCQRHQLLGETVHQYVADLRGLATLCKFGALQDQMIRDQLIEHTNMEKLREMLLLEPDDLTLAKALQLAFQVESAADCTAQLKQLLSGSLHT